MTFCFRQGGRVIIADVNEAYGSVVAKEISGKFIKFDQSKEVQWQMLKHFVKKEFGNLDGLVNNAGWRFIYGDTDDIEKIRVEAWKDISAILLDGTFLGCKFGLEMMKETPSAEGLYIFTVYMNC